MLLFSQETAMFDQYILHLNAQIAELKGRISGLEQARSRYEQLHSSTAPAPFHASRPAAAALRQASPAKRPSKMREITWSILGDHPHGLTSRQINDLAKDRDPSINERSVTSMLSVSAREGELVRDAGGRYQRPSVVAAQAATIEAADGADDPAASDELKEDDDGGYERAAA